MCEKCSVIHLLKIKWLNNGLKAPLIVVPVISATKDPSRIKSKVFEKEKKEIVSLSSSS